MDGSRSRGDEPPFSIGLTLSGTELSALDPAMLPRARGCLLGQLAGDALGSLVEFQSAADIRQQYPGGVRRMATGGTWDTLAGQPTDDSELALMLARSIVNRGGYDREAVAQAYAYWLSSAPFDVGNTTRQALSAPSRADVAAGRAAARMAEAASRTSQANGSLMRASPLGIWGYLLAPGQLAGFGRDDSALTHPHPACQEACAVFVIAVARAIRTGQDAAAVYEGTLDWAVGNCREGAVLDTLRSAALGGPPVGAPSGWVLVAFQNAFHQFLHAPSLEEGIVATVMLGGDTDTNAAIAGALLGAVHGVDAVPQQWRDAVLGCRPMASAPGVRQPRPRAFWPVDALDLAAQLLRAHRPK